MFNQLLRQSLILSIVFFMGYSAYAQSAAINTDGSSAAASAALDIKSTTKGLLIPRMLASERILIGSPAEGLLVYQTDAPAGFYFYKAGVWTSLSATPGWSITGNSGTADATNFIGTTDNIPFNIRVNNEKAGRIDPTLSNAFFGHQAGNNNTAGSYNTATGTGAFQSNTTGAYNTAIGYQSLQGNNGQQNTAIGSYSLLSNTNGSNNTSLGYSADVSTGGLSNATAIGYDAVVNASNKVQIGNSSVTAVQLGTGTTVTLETGRVKLTGGAPGVGKVLTSDAAGLASWQAAGGSSWGLTGNIGTSDATNFIGTTDNIPFNIRVNNQRSGKIDPVLLNAFFGYQTGNLITTGNSNTATGTGALYATSTGSYNTAAGAGALEVNSIGSYNTANGGRSLYNNTQGNFNTANGYNALIGNSTGSNNTALGFNANTASGALTNAMAIGANAVVNASNKVQIGDGLITDVQLGSTGAAVVTLMTGLIKLVGGNPGAGKVLTSDGSGLGSWQSNAGAGWGLTGNAGTVDGTNFIGTTDDVPFNIRVNNQKAGRIDNAGNSFYGYQAGNANTGTANTATGFLALKNNTTGAGNVANGTNALVSNSTGNNNTANGNSALYSNSTGSSNTANGVSALANNSTGDGNTANGYQALYSNIIGTDNVASGYQALYNNTTGSRNIANGVGALLSNTSGNSNTAIGYQSLQGNNGQQNTAIGSGALLRNSTGNFNTATGISTLLFSTIGIQNTANGSFALQNNLTGDNNTAIGLSALLLNTTGTLNTGLGYRAYVSTGALSNATAIGANSIVNVSNKVRLGDATVTVIEGQAPYSFPSDGRFKININDSDVKGLDFINRLRPVVYNFDTKKFEGFITKSMPDSIRQRYMKDDFSASTGIRQSGFIAQEVEKAAMASGYNFNGVHKPENDNDHYSLAYSQFVVPLVKGMQEQQQMIVKQQQEIEAMKKQIAELIKQKN